MARSSGFGEALQRARRAAGLSQAELGSPAYSRSYVSLLESGARAPSRDVLAHVAAKLDLDPTVVRAWALADDDAGEAVATTLQVEVALLLASGHPELLLAGGGPAQRGDLRSYALDADRVDLWWVATFLSLDVALDSRRLDEAVDIAHRLLDHWLTTSSPVLEGRARTRLSVALRASGRPDLGVEEARRACALLGDSPDGVTAHVEALTALVSALGAQRRTTEALVVANELEALAPRATDPTEAGKAYWAVANVHITTGSPERAFALFARAGELIDPNRHLRRWGRLHAAAAAARLATRIDLDAVPALLDRAGQAFAITGTPEDRARLDVARGMSAAHQEHWPEARALLESALAHEDALGTGDRADAHQYLGEVLAQLGEHEAAASHLRTATALLRDA